MTRTKTILRALLGVGAAGAIAAFGTFSAFSSTTDNPGNQITTGTVTLDNNGNGFGGLLTLDDFQQVHKTWATGLQHNPGGTWTQNEAQWYRFRVIVRDT